jgi:uroporphyrin-III C-methyltransferase/precorrin-2 dehydrogenase/sirohydrochlorin ferrochelatase
MTMSGGFVSLVGAGPGDPDLLTLRAVDRLRSADLVLHDGLVPAAVLALAGAAECVSVARRVGEKRLSQQDVCDLMVAAARMGQRVVRLKSGDPFVFGRGGEEVHALIEAGIPFEVVPGLSTAIAAPTLAGIPVTHRGVSSGLLVVSGHAPEAWAPLLGAIPPGAATVVVLMGKRTRGDIAAFLIERGWHETQQVWTGDLLALAGSPEIGGDDRPAVIVIGEVVTAAAMPHEVTAILAEEHTWQSMTIRQP